VEDLPLSAGYVEPLYLSPVYQRRTAIGSRGFPFDHGDAPNEWYQLGSCPVAERLHQRELLTTGLVREPLTSADMDDFADAVAKVATGIDQLR
jgi:hypothetical protein